MTALIRSGLRAAGARGRLERAWTCPYRIVPLKITHGNKDRPLLTSPRRCDCVVCGNMTAPAKVECTSSMMCMQNGKKTNCGTNTENAFHFLCMCEIIGVEQPFLKPEFGPYSQYVPRNSTVLCCVHTDTHRHTPARCMRQPPPAGKPNLRSRTQPSNPTGTQLSAQPAAASVPSTGRRCERRFGRCRTGLTMSPCLVLPATDGKPMQACF